MHIDNNKYTKIHKSVATRTALFGSNMHQIVFRLGLCPRPYFGRLGLHEKKKKEGKGEKKRGGRGRKKREGVKERKGRGREAREGGGGRVLLETFPRP